MNLSRLLQTVQQGRGYTGNLREMPQQMMNPSTGKFDTAGLSAVERNRLSPAELSGINEFLECAKSVPLSRINECIDELTQKPFLPKSLEVQVKPDWLWLALGFVAGWILKR